ncbi:MAG: hypothetical protein JRE63_01080 [Deltaproteobacteria bacterium]|jgi:hypothetical protein|nr:hypothetical protein [Deltaproteobacteria bacterium]
MYNRLKMFLGVCLVLVLWACAPAPPPPEVAEEPDDRKERPQDFDTQALTGVVVEKDPVWRLSYPYPALYQPGAALPSPEGLEHLEALARWLQKYPSQAWEVSVNAKSEAGKVEAGLLAAKRQELLSQFFRRKGLSQTGWVWQAVTGGDFQLRFSFPEKP